MSALKLVCLNIELDRHLDRVIPFLKMQAPDIVLLQEVFIKDISIIESALQMKSISTLMNLRQWGDTRQTCGIVTFSALPVLNSWSAYYRGSKDYHPLIYEGESAEVVAEKTARAILVTEVIKREKQYRLVNTHFTWTPDGKPNEKQFQDLERLFHLLVPLPDFILCGDFNAPRSMAIFDALASRYKDNIPSEVTTTIDQKLHRVKNLQLVVDGLFTTSHYHVSSIELFDNISDHLGIVAEVTKTA